MQCGGHSAHCRQLQWKPKKTGFGKQKENPNHSTWLRVKTLKERIKILIPQSGTTTNPTKLNPQYENFQNNTTFTNPTKQKLQLTTNPTKEQEAINPKSLNPRNYPFVGSESTHPLPPSPDHPCLAHKD
jgi:hypothetical protein